MAFFCLSLALPLRAFDWETCTVNGRDYVSLHSFCVFYGFGYQAPSGNDRFVSRSASHSISLKAGNADMYLDGVHYVMSFPIESGDHDWLVSRMDVIKLFEPILRPSEISGRHTIRGVVIDAGHGGSDNGATSRLGAEKRYTLDTGNRLDEILRDAGLKTVFTRRSDVFVDLYERAHIASLYPDYCFVSIHFNSAMEEARGLETYCLSPRGAASTSSSYLTRGDIQKLPGNDYDTQNILLASMVHSEIIKLNPGDPTADRGVKRARFVVIKQNVLPAILVEGGFVSNHMEASRVDQADYRQKLAQAIARGVIRFVNAMGDRNLPLPEGSPGNSEPPAASVPPPRAIAVAPPPAPSGLAHPSPGIKVDVAAVSVVTPKTGTGTSPATATNIPKVKKDKPKKPLAAPVIANTVNTTNSADNPSGPIPPPENAASGATNSSSSVVQPPAHSPRTPLDLGEPAVPTTTPGMDNGSAEPDEPPTVNIYPTTATSSASSTKTNAPTPVNVYPTTPAASAKTNVPSTTPDPPAVTQP